MTAKPRFFVNDKKCESPRRVMRLHYGRIDDINQRDSFAVADRVSETWSSRFRLAAPRAHTARPRNALARGAYARRAAKRSPVAELCDNSNILKRFFHALALCERDRFAARVPARVLVRSSRRACSTARLRYVLDEYSSI